MMRSKADRIYLKTGTYSNQWLAVPVESSLFDIWKKNGVTKESYEIGTLIHASYNETNVEEYRGFYKKLSDAARKHEIHQGFKLQVAFSPSNHLSMDPIWIEVSDVKRSYDLGMQFQGHIIESSYVLPQLRANLNMVVSSDSVLAYMFQGQPQSKVFRGDREF